MQRVLFDLWEGKFQQCRTNTTNPASRICCEQKLCREPLAVDAGGDSNAAKAAVAAGQAHLSDAWQVLAATTLSATGKQPPQ